MGKGNRRLVDCSCKVCEGRRRRLGLDLPQQVPRQGDAQPRDVAGPRVRTQMELFEELAEERSWSERRRDLEGYPVDRRDAGLPPSCTCDVPCSYESINEADWQRNGDGFGESEALSTCTCGYARCDEAYEQGKCIAF